MNFIEGKSLTKQYKQLGTYFATDPAGHKLTSCELIIVIKSGKEAQHLAYFAKILEYCFYKTKKL